MCGGGGGRGEGGALNTSLIRHKIVRTMGSA